jgi:hypothetical protein
LSVGKVCVDGRCPGFRDFETTNRARRVGTVTSERRCPMKTSDWIAALTLVVNAVSMVCAVVPLLTK